VHAWIRTELRAGRWQNRIVPMLERVRTDQVVVGFFCHEPGEPATWVEWWQEPCIAFTAGVDFLKSTRGPMHGAIHFRNVGCIGVVKTGNAR
jgi:hypothetical protein